MSPHFSLLPRVAAAVTLAIGLAVLTGWIFGISALRSVLPGEAEMEANAAIGLLLAAGSLLILTAKGAHSRRDAQMLAFAVLLLGLATLGQYIFDVDLNIDELFFRDTTDPHGKVRGRMSPYSAVAFVGIGLALSSVHSPSLRPLVWAASGLVALLKNADTAMYRAKHSGGNQICFYTEDLNANAMERLRLEADLRRALASGEFELHYDWRPSAAAVDPNFHANRLFASSARRVQP